MLLEDRQSSNSSSSSSSENESSNESGSTKTGKPLLTGNKKPKNPKTKKKSTKVQATVRVKSGCFCCRKRKKKCDEKQPSCSGCKRNFLKCVYPSYENQILPRDFEIESTDVVVMNKKSPNKQAKTPVNNNFNNQLIPLNNDMLLLSSSSAGSTEFFSTEDIDLSQFLTDPLTVLSSFSQYIPNVQLNDIDSELYFQFVHRFLPSVSPSYSHPKLSPKEIWVPLASESEILREVFFSCGASQLAYKYPEYQKMSIEKYNKSVKMISNLITNRTVEGTEDWLFTAILTLCLRDRASGYNGSRCAQHLVAAYKIIRERERKKYLEIPNINLSLEDEITSVENPSVTSFSVTPTERTLVESFIFNYCIALYTCSYNNLIMLPSPFILFREISVWLKAPIYNDVDVEWMNNPVLGSSLNEFEVIAKLVWLLRLHYCVDESDSNHINEDIFWKLITSLKTDIDNIELSIFDNLKGIELSTEGNKDALRTSLSITFIMYHAAKILLQKLVNPSLSSSFHLIQESVQIIISEAQLIPEDDHSLCLCVLGIFIAGTASTTDTQRQMITKLLVDLSDLLFSNFGLNVLGILQRSWNRETEEKLFKGELGYKSFDLLFDREEVEAISF